MLIKKNPFYCSIVTRSWKAHQVKYVTSQDPIMVEYKDISYFYIQCQDFVATNLPCEHVHFYQFILFNFFLNVMPIACWFSDLGLIIDLFISPIFEYK